MLCYAVAATEINLFYVAKFQVSLLTSENKEKLNKNNGNEQIRIRVRAWTTKVSFCNFLLLECVYVSVARKELRKGK
jgi:hypothetical protein